MEIRLISVVLGKIKFIKEISRLCIMELSTKLMPPDYADSINSLTKVLKEASEPLSKKVKGDDLEEAIKKKIESQVDAQVEEFTKDIKGDYYYRFIYSLVGDLMEDNKRFVSFLSVSAKFLPSLIP